MKCRARWIVSLLVSVGALLLAARVARSQPVITEVMHNPGGTDALWEWVEVRNPSSEPLNLHGWVFDDHGDASFTKANIVNTNGNTVIPAGGVAVLYPGDELEFLPERFTNAWGAGITMIAVDGFTALTASDAIGLWPSHEAYMMDAIPGSTTTPRRTFAHASAALDYQTGFPVAATGRSIAWRGVGSSTTGSNWVASSNGAFGAHVSVQTTRPGTPINSVADRGSPGSVPAGGGPSGLLITEVMYDPASPEPAWEWVEVLNNTGSVINFGSTFYVFDDDDEASLATPNITSGTIAAGATGVLFNAEAGGNTLANMQAAWGESINFIPVTTWTDLSNGGDSIAIWSSFAAYQSETQSMTSPRRTMANAVAVLAYDDDTMLGWPSNNNAASIFLSNLSSNPALPASWTRSNDSNSAAPQPVLSEVIDHPGNDIGSPGFVPGVSTPLEGDFNGNGVVDAADYIRWRETDGTATGYNVWRTNFGRTAASGAGLAVAVPEPAGIVLVVGLVVLVVRRR